MDRTVEVAELRILHHPDLALCSPNEGGRGFGAAGLAGADGQSQSAWQMMADHSRGLIEAYLSQSEPERDEQLFSISIRLRSSIHPSNPGQDGGHGHNTPIGRLPHTGDLGPTGSRRPSAESASPTERSCAYQEAPNPGGKARLGSIPRLGRDAIENCIPPPHRSPSTPSDPSIPSRSLQSRIQRSRHRLKTLKPWPTYKPVQLGLAYGDDHPTYDLVSLSDSSLHSNRHGFWLIPVWKETISQSDLYGRFGHLISLPTWSDPRLSQLVSASTQSHPPALSVPPIVWNPYRLNLFWKVISIICEKRKLGDVTAIACSTSRSKHVPLVDPSDPTRSHHVPQRSEDVFGDHLRIWSDLRTSLIIRRVISDVTIRAALQACGASTNRPVVPFHDVNSSGQILETHAGSHEEKWLKNCTLMWFDETGTPRGCG